MVQTPAGCGTTRNEECGQGTAWPYGQSGRIGRRSRFLCLPTSWRRPAAAAGLLAVALAAEVLIVAGWVPLTDLVTQVLAELIIVTGVAAVATMIRT
jgi:hypothetical protein